MRVKAASSARLPADAYGVMMLASAGSDWWSGGCGVRVVIRGNDHPPPKLVEAAMTEPARTNGYLELWRDADGWWHADLISRATAWVRRAHRCPYAAPKGGPR